MSRLSLSAESEDAMGSRVLVVEDEPMIGMNLMDVAEGLGCEVAGPAISASSTLAAAADRPPDIRNR